MRLKHSMRLMGTMDLTHSMRSMPVLTPCFLQNRILNRRRYDYGNL
ncbi:CRISPR-associated DxTHG motif protein [Allobaculum sp. Allo2]|nr:TM1812 family CRISPR-associated protein [Allobaculum sp. Allo2]